MPKKYQSSRYTNYIKSYSWRKKSLWVRSLTRPCWLPKSAKGRCSLFPILPAQHTHHMTYFCVFNIGWNWFGFEMPLVHLVPLSRFSHRLIHKEFFWWKPIRFFVNLYLRISFLIIWTICKPLFSLPLWFGIYFLIENIFIPKFLTN